MRRTRSLPTNGHLAALALLFASAPVWGDIPDELFDSLASAWPAGGVAVLLTGMRDDGARGLARLRQLGWHTIAQDRQTCVVYGMPKAAVELNAAVEVLPLPAIGPAALARLRGRCG